MKELIVILLIIFASLAFGEEIKLGHLPKTETYTMPGVGTLTVDMHRTESIDSFQIDVYLTCDNTRAGKKASPLPLPKTLIKTITACEYTSTSYFEGYDDIIVGFIPLALQSGPSHCLSLDDAQVYRPRMRSKCAEMNAR